MNFVLLSALQRKRQPLELFLLELQKQSNGDSSGWQNIPSGKLSQSKIPILHTPPTTLQHLPTKYTQVKSPWVVNPADLETWKPPYVPFDRWLPYWGPPPQSMPTTKWQANICAKMSISVLQRRPTTHPHRATTYWAHIIGSVSLLCFQHGKRYMQSWHDHHWGF